MTARERIEISRRILLVNSASAVAVRVISVGVLAWLFQYLVHEIPDDEFQLYQPLIALMLLFQLATPIFVSALQRYVTEAYARGDDRRVTALVSTMTPPMVGVAALVLAAGWLTAWYVDSVLSVPARYVGEARVMLALLMLSGALRLALAPFGLGFVLRQRFVLRNAVSLGAEMLRITLLLVLVLAVSPRVLWVVVAMVIANLAELLVVTVVSMRMVPELRWHGARFDRTLLSPLWSFGKWMVFGRLGLLIRESSDPWILNRLATPTDVTAFTIGSLPDTHLRRMFLEAYAIAQPALTAMHATDQEARLRRTYVRLSRYSLWILMAIAAPLFVYRVPVMQLYLGTRYDDLVAAVTVMALLLARDVLIFPNSVIGMVANAKARVRELTLAGLLISLTNLGLTIYLVGVLDMGAVGSALGTLLVTALGAPLLMWRLGMALTGVRLGPWLRAAVLPGIAPTCVGVPVWWAVEHWWPAHTVPALIGDGLIGAVAYGATVLLLGLQPEDRQDLGRGWRRLRAAWSTIRA